MRISFLLADGFGLGGGNRVIALQAGHLARAGHQVRLIAPPPRPETLREGLSRRLRGRTRPAPPSLAEGHFARAGLDLQILDRHRPITAADVPDGDAVIATWWETAEWVAALPAAKGTRVHLVQDHEVFPYLPQDRTRAVYRLPLRRIAISRWLQTVLREDYGDADCLLVENAVDTARFIAPPRPRGIPPRIGVLHSPAPRKNIGLAVAALTRAKAARPDLQALAFGTTPPGAAGLPGWITYHQRPDQDRIPGLYAACDAWLFPSHSEGFGLPILEAMACGTPVLATPAGAAPDYVTPATGRLLPATEEAFTAAILEIAAMADADWQALSQAARTRARARDWTDAGREFEAALTRILAEPDPAAAPRT